MRPIHFQFQRIIAVKNPSRRRFRDGFLCLLSRFLFDKFTNHCAANHQDSTDNLQWQHGFSQKQNRKQHCRTMPKIQRIFSFDEKKIDLPTKRIVPTKTNRPTVYGVIQYVSCLTESKKQPSILKILSFP